MFLSSIFTNSLPDAGIAAYGGTLPTSSLMDVVSVILSAVLSLLGVIFLMLTVYAGVLWMTAQGDSKKVEKAQSILQQALIGLVICVLAFGMTWFVASKVYPLIVS